MTDWSSTLLTLLQSGPTSSPSKSSLSRHVAKALNGPQSCDVQLSSLCSGLRECRDPSFLKQIVAALSTNVDVIVRRKHVTLVISLLESCWQEHQDSCKGVADIIRTVVTSDNEFCAPVLNTLTSRLIPTSGDAAFIVPLAVRRVHGLISAVLEAVPTAVNIFLAALRGSWPHKSLPINIRAGAFCQALVACTYVPAAFEMVMFLVFDSLVQLDAECNYEEPASDGAKPDDASELVFEMDESLTGDQEYSGKLDKFVKVTQLKLDD